MVFIARVPGVVLQHSGTVTSQDADDGGRMNVLLHFRLPRAACTPYFFLERVIYLHDGQDQN